ncbi:MAG: Sec-independent protein translocase subunit TatA [Gordonia sp. (in: high G+C Gram-positive bacteria)]|uniref:Sec-independent protein translocase subunit TatA n=1 Tax=Gordonia sp. (in: high G+C Gram-positive bacteria) TaxID=84139 RepID=UPI0039E422FB
MGAMQPWHWIVIIVVLVLLFGSAKLPQMARGLGQSLRIFKSEVSEMTGDKDKAAPVPKELPSAEQNAADQAAAPAPKTSDDPADK